MQQDHVSVKVWDAPVRWFHWALVLLVVFQIYSVKAGQMLWHAYGGYAILALVLFRVVWGFVGGRHARFADFLAGPAACVAFARKLLSREPAARAGHNPLGGWMVVLLLASLALQAVAGLFANDDIAMEGPLAALVSKDLSDRLTTFHRYNAQALIVLAVLHIAAVLYHWLFKKENLIGAMFSGSKRLPAGDARPLDAAEPGIGRGLVVFALAAVLVFLIVKRPF